MPHTSYLKSTLTRCVLAKTNRRSVTHGPSWPRRIFFKIFQDSIFFRFSPPLPSSHKINFSKKENDKQQQQHVACQQANQILQVSFGPHLPLHSQVGRIIRRLSFLALDLLDVHHSLVPHVQKELGRQAYHPHHSQLLGHSPILPWTTCRRYLLGLRPQPQN